MRPREIISYFSNNPLNVKKLSQTLLGPHYNSKEEGSEYLATFFIDLIPLDGLQLRHEQTLTAVTHKVPYVFIHRWWDDDPQPYGSASGIEVEYDLDPRGATSDLRYVIFTFQGLPYPISINKWKL